MGLQEVKTELEKLDKEDLVKHITDLYKKYKPVKEYLDYHINPDDVKLLKKYKGKVTEGFYPKRGYELNLSISRKALDDFIKFEPPAISIADLFLHFAEKGVEFTNEFGDIDEEFYMSVEEIYFNALNIIAKNGLSDQFEKRAYKIVTDTNGIGWGFHDDLYRSYNQFYK